MSMQIVSTRIPDANPQPERTVEDIHRDAQNLINWLSIPSVGLKYNLEAAYLITMFKLCMSSPTAEEATNDIELLIEYVRDTVEKYGAATS